MSTLEKLHAAILQYIEEKNTDYAIMVNGVWGSGKTYFLKQKLFPELEKSKPELKLIYLSLFGVTGSSDLNRKIYLEVYPFLNSKIAKTVGIIGKVVISKLGFSDINEDDKSKLLEVVGKIDSETVVIVFDDLERLEKKLLIEILGYINQMVEHNNIKVIISANEREIIDNIGKKNGNYNRYIEKVARHKLLFELDFNEIGNEILKSNGIHDNYHSMILEAFTKGENKNLRTLQFVSSMSLKILESLAKYEFSSAQLKIKVEGIALYFFASLSIEGKASRLKYLDMKKLASWSMDKPFDFASIDFSKIKVVEEGNSKKNSSEDGSVQQQYFDRYFSPNQMMYIDSLLDFLESGYWDEERFLKEIEHVEKYLTTRGVSESNQLMENLFNVLYVEDDNLDQIVNGVLEFVKAGEYPLDKYLRIYLVILELVDMKLIKYNKKMLHKDILMGIKECKDDKATSYIEDFISISPNANKLIKNIYQKTLKRNLEIKQDAFSKVSDEHLLKLFDNPDEYNRKYLSKQGEFIPCLHFACSPNKFVEKYSELSNQLKYEFNTVFYLRQKSSVQMDKSEMDWMRKLKDKLSKDIKKSKPSISILNKKRLEQAIDKVIESWASIEHQLEQ